MQDNDTTKTGLTKRDIVVAVSDEIGLTQREVSVVFESVLEVMSNGLAQGARVSLRELGTFEVKKAKEKLGRNPKQPEKTVVIPARATVKFRPAKVLKERVARLLPSL